MRNYFRLTNPRRPQSSPPPHPLLSLMNSPNPLLSLTTFMWYYLKLGTLFPIAYLFNQSFIINHPNCLFPTLISPPWNHTIHSFYPSSNLKTYLYLHCNPPPFERHWLQAEDLKQRMANSEIKRAITLDGTLSGPSLRQGMVIVQHHHVIFIGPELGRWPTREDYIVTYSFNANSGNSFPLFIPVRHINLFAVREDTPHSPLYVPIPLSDITPVHCKIPFPVPPSQNV